PEQVQDFYPTPSTVSTVMYYTGIDPVSKRKVYVCRNPHEKAMQRALIQYRNPNNYELVYEALTKAGREDLIGFEKKCLIRPRYGGKNKERAGRAVSKKTGAEKQKPAKKKKTIRNVHKKKKEA
ncbi:MAG TPA: YgiQ family radical SAM protein, partial [Lachnospiraceae bacterium]|nr:YgiQ family radical SAM protein [Lachnospiraceae bacterium]